MAAADPQSVAAARPSLTRSRSNTSPPPTQIPFSETASATLSLARPSHFRSKSYVSPTARKESRPLDPAATNTDKPAEYSRFPRLHLPGKHHHHHQQQTHSLNEEHKLIPHRKGHRYTQSEAQQYRRKNESSRIQDTSPSDTAPHVDHPTDAIYPSSRGTAIPSLKRMTSARSHRGGIPSHEGPQSVRGAGLRSANNDARSPTSPAHSRSTDTIELEFEKSEARRLKAYNNATQSDVDRLMTQVDTARSELATRLLGTTRTASGLVRRLDEAHNTLHRTAESLIDTVSSFSNLVQQSSKLLSNFDVETSNLDSSTRQRIRKFRTEICTKRADRVSELEHRGHSLNDKAEKLSRRLENCKVMVRNWESKELNKRKAWKGVRNGIMWGFFLILIGVLAGVISWKAVQISAGSGTSEQVLNSLIRNETWSERSPASARVPEDIRSILQDIVSRSRRGQSTTAPQLKVSIDESRTAKKVDRRLRMLDEL